MSRQDVELDSVAVRDDHVDRDAVSGRLLVGSTRGDGVGAGRHDKGSRDVVSSICSGLSEIREWLVRRFARGADKVDGRCGG